MMMAATTDTVYEKESMSSERKREEMAATATSI
jgi:hypothetical protein